MRSPTELLPACSADPAESPAAAIEQRLVWTRLPTTPSSPRYWFGLGLMSDHGLPLCSMHMFLAAKALESTRPSAHPLVVLLADAHALQAGHAAADVCRRARIRAQEVRAIASALGLDVQVRLASQMGADPLFSSDSDRTRAWLASPEANDLPSLPVYIQRGIADVLYFNRVGGVKIGWSVSRRIEPGQGRHHEPETDLVAARIDPATSAVYVRHGVTLDVRRPRAVPYTEMNDPEQRLMLTGPVAGRYAARLRGCRLSARRRAEVLDHLALTIEACETLVGPLPGIDPVAKAERFQHELAVLLHATAPDREPTSAIEVAVRSVHV